MRKWIIATLCSVLAANVSMASAQEGMAPMKVAESYVFHLFQGEVAHVVSNLTLDGITNPARAQAFVEQRGPIYRSHFETCRGIKSISAETAADGQRSILVRVSFTFNNPSGDNLRCQPNNVLVNVVRVEERWVVIH